MKNPDIPGNLFWLFKWFCKSDLFEELQGDLEEAFEENIVIHGKVKAEAIYRKEIIKMIRPSVLKHLNLIPAKMSHLPKNYLKTSLRAFKLNPFYISANVFGLALALSICTIGYFNYRYNATFNEHFQDAENLYKVHGLRVGETTVGSSSAPLVPMIKTSGIQAARYTRKNVAIRLEKKLFQERMAFADPEFFDFFPMINLNGEKLRAPQNNEIAISESMAMKLFNEIYPVGELVYLVFPNQKEQSYVVNDVFKEFPTNVSFNHSAIMALENYFDIQEIAKNDWSHWVDGTFIYLENQEVDRVEKLLGDYIEVQNNANPELSISGFRLDTITSWPEFENSLYKRRFKGHLHPSSVIGIAGSAIAILLLACFNFINTSIALSGKRLKEIAVRKILGGNRKSTITQFMIENTFMISIAVILSFGISYLLIPSYNALFMQELIQLQHVPFVTLLKFSFVLILIVTLLSAAYPSLYISKFPPLIIFRNKIILSGKNRLMVVLLTFQFSLCFYNMFGIFLLVDNARYQETLDRGYNVDQVINVPLNRPEQFGILKDYLSQNPDVQAVAGAESLIGFSNNQNSLNHEGVDYQVAILSVGVNYSESLGLRLSKGSFFSGSEANTESNEIIINKMLQDRLGADLLNQAITLSGEKYTVIGIVDDFNLRSIIMDNKIMPTVVKLSNQANYRYAVVKVNGSPEEVNYQIEKAWYEAFPLELYTGFLQKEVLLDVSETNRIMIKINLFMGVISILISVLGLYTLISLTVQKRSKEFGVRKVLGASRSVIIHLLGRDLYWMLGVASILGLTGSAYVLNLVFDIIYAYHMSPDFLHFVKAILAVLVIVIIAVGYKAYQTGRMNPVQQLRAE